MNSLFSFYGPNLEIYGKSEKLSIKIQQSFKVFSWQKNNSKFIFIPLFIFLRWSVGFLNRNHSSEREDGGRIESRPASRPPPVPIGVSPSSSVCDDRDCKSQPHFTSRGIDN